MDINNIVSVTKVYDVDGVTFGNTYKVIFNTDNVVFVPHSTANTDYQAIQDWIAAGNSVVDPNAE